MNKVSYNNLYKYENVKEYTNSIIKMRNKFAIPHCYRHMKMCAYILISDVDEHHHIGSFCLPRDMRYTVEFSFFSAHVCCQHISNIINKSIPYYIDILSYILRRILLPFRLKHIQFNLSSHIFCTCRIILYSSFSICKHTIANI